MSKNKQKNKGLILDVDFRNTGTSSIARNDKAIERMFGYPPIHIKSGNGFKKLMDDLGSKVNIEQEYGVKTKFQLSDKFKDLDFIAVDTLSGLQTFIKQEIQGNRSNFTMNDWGRLKTVMMDYLTKLAITDVHVIAFAHTKTTQDNELGRLVEIPGLGGSTGRNLGQYFDNMLYTFVEVNENSGRRRYYWQVAPDERRNARSLPSVTEYALKNKGLIEQDFKKFYDLIRKDTDEPVKTLILGSFGTGKTYSLRTLVDAKL